MEVEKIFDYVEDDSVETGIDIAIVTEETRNENVENSYIPASFSDQSGSVKRIATYVDWYTEFATLYIHKHGAGIDYVKKILETLKENGLKPYEFREIGFRRREDVKIEEEGEGFRVTDLKRGIYFSTETSSNPNDLEN